jgi:hypothetical protein
MKQKVPKCKLWMICISIPSCTITIIICIISIFSEV